MMKKSSFSVTQNDVKNSEFLKTSYINAAPFIQSVSKPNRSIKPYDIYEDEKLNKKYLKESLKMTTLLDKIFGVSNRGLLNRLTQESNFDLNTSMITEDMNIQAHTERFCKRQIYLFFNAQNFSRGVYDDQTIEHYT